METTSSGARTGRLAWQTAEVLAVRRETPRAARVVLRPQHWRRHLPGQHVDVRLTAEDGYTAQRSYSLASPPEQEGSLEVVVERLADGEVSPFLVDELRAGDALELRGPVGRWFVWEDALGGPVQLVAGGSGVVPFLAMLAHHRAVGSAVPLRLLASARTADDLIGADLLAAPGPAATTTVTLTRGAPAGWSGPVGRVDAALLAAHAVPPEQRPQVFVCGSHGFVETVTGALVGLGHDPARVKTERFGATGSRAGA